MFRIEARTKTNERRTIEHFHFRFGLHSIDDRRPTTDRATTDDRPLPVPNRSDDDRLGYRDLRTTTPRQWTPQDVAASVASAATTSSTPSPPRRHATSTETPWLRPPPSWMPPPPPFFRYASTNGSTTLRIHSAAPLSPPWPIEREQRTPFCRPAARSSLPTSPPFCCHLRPPANKRHEWFVLLFFSRCVRRPNIAPSDPEVG